ncbi:hypothetical protein PUNSTDRAFT_65058 [Punctularia strigosozonata HHB-11173 SS5]|uniref:uncharacterized protein n=1 Tax=Punctularia strigosozonata (strain HHB-11173) TaxID=741275 RepID=UPI0004416F40|nr:uncharacterized protein PUNSTDRAFT_65058 [Punctularia strigosozonata HHB-11173 SS5]EIN10322.1 hypothetical protein PUNSTDRAFT_65058 [Punctularia strigosozonata HHB-11173 SS5]
MHIGLGLLVVPLSLLLFCAAHARAEPTEHEQAHEYALHHRIYFPTLDEQLPFALRGRFSLSSSSNEIQKTGVKIEPPESLEHDLAAFAQIAADRPEADEVLYQLALQRDAAEAAIDPATWSVAYVKACHLPLATEETVVLHLAEGKAYALDYFVGPVPADGRCPRTTTETISFAPFSNTTVIVKEPRTPPQPELRQPPPLNAQGEVVKPPPEKSFLQKYWVYIAVALIALCAYLSFFRRILVPTLTLVTRSTRSGRRRPGTAGRRGRKMITIDGSSQGDVRYTLLLRYNGALSLRSALTTR